MKVKSTKKIKSKTKNSNQLELTFRENIKNKKNTNSKYNKSFNAISRILNSSSFIMGEEIDILENKLKNFTNSKHVISCSSGTDALLLALMAINIKPGDEIITTPFSFISTAEVIALLGAKPVFVDINLNNLSARKVFERLSTSLF